MWDGAAVNFGRDGLVEGADSVGGGGLACGLGGGS